MKPIIGVMPLWDEEKDSLWMFPPYLEGIKQAGGIPFVFPFLENEEDIKKLASLCDGFLFTGGPDISPSLYHEEVKTELVHTLEKRDYMEKIVFEYATKNKKSILGICRGFQFINVMLGGSLYQDIPSFHPSSVNHRQPAPYDKPIHDVKINKDSPLYECLKTEVLPVNSCHHQGIKELANSLKEMAISSDDLVEAIYMPSYPFLWGFQWHPELLLKTSESSLIIFEAFINSMK